MIVLRSVLRAVVVTILSPVAKARGGTPPAIESGTHITTGPGETSGYTLTPSGGGASHSLVQDQVQGNRIVSFQAHDADGNWVTFTWNYSGFYEVLGTPPNWSQYRFQLNGDGTYTYQLGKISPSTGNFNPLETGTATPGVS